MVAIDLGGVDFTGVVAGGGILALFGLFSTLTWRAQKRDDRITRMQDARIEIHAKELRDVREAYQAELQECRRAQERSERRTSVLIWACQKAGIDIPTEVWGDGDR